jgi:hypothetical protein
MITQLLLICSGNEDEVVLSVIGHCDSHDIGAMSQLHLA